MEIISKETIVLPTEDRIDRIEHVKIRKEHDKDRKRRVALNKMKMQHLSFEAPQLRRERVKQLSIVRRKEKDEKFAKQMEFFNKTREIRLKIRKESYLKFVENATKKAIDWFSQKNPWTKGKVITYDYKKKIFNVTEELELEKKR